MTTEIKVWEVREGRLELIGDTALGSEHLEAELESWIAESPGILGDDLLVIGRQRNIEGVGRLDLLCIDRAGKLVIVELKRQSTPREAVAQALDYASWLDGRTDEEISAFAEEHLHRSLSEAFLEHFQTEMPAVICQNHRVLLVAPRLDATAERIINYLAGRYKVDVNAVFFKYVKLASGQELLMRSVLVPEVTSVGAAPPSLANLIRNAAERKVLDLVQICRQLNTVWQEESTTTYGGSLRYWAEAPDGSDRMVYGVNVAGERMRSPTGALDVWFPTKRLSECTAVPESDIRGVLSSEHSLLAAQPTDCIVRVSTSVEAERLVAQLRDWAAQRRNV